MNRKTLQALAKERVKDAKALLGRKRWAAAFYLTGYGVECGLKACVLRYIDAAGMLFSEATYLKKLADCWTHDPKKLIHLAGLDEAFGLACGANATLKRNWLIVQEWKETSRYQTKAEAEARELFAAVTDEPDGVLPWIRNHW